MKKILITLAGVIGLFAILIYASWLFLNSSFLADMLAQKCEALSGSALIFKKNPKITLFPASISLEDISWQNNEKELDIHFSARFIRLSFDLSSLLKNQIHIREIFVNEAQLNILNKGGTSQDNLPNNTAIGQSNAALEKLPFQLDRIVLQNSSLSYTKSESVLWLSHMNLSAEHFGLRQESDIKCDFSLALGKSDEREAEADISGNMAIRTKLHYYAPNLTFRQTALTFTAINEQTIPTLSPLSLEAEGSLNLNELSLHINSSQLKTSIFQCTLKGDYLANQNTFNGHISLDYNPVSNQKNLEEGQENTTYNIVLTSPIQFNESVLNLPDIAISSGDSKGAGKLKYIFSNTGQSAKLQGNLAFCALNFPNKKKDEKSIPKSKIIQNKKNKKRVFIWPEIDISFSTPNINYDRFSTKDVHFQIQGESGKYDLKNLQFLWASGKAEGLGHISLPDQILFLQITGKDIDIGRALWELGIDGFKDGIASFETKLAFSGFDASTIKKSLAGNFSFNAKQVKVSLLEDMVKFLSRFNSKASLLPNGIDLFSVKAQAENGRINLDPMLLESKELKALAHGNIDLATDGLNAQLSLNVFGMTLPIALSGKLSKPSWRIEPTWFKRFF